MRFSKAVIPRMAAFFLLDTFENFHYIGCVLSKKYPCHFFGNYYHGKYFAGYTFKSVFKSKEASNRIERYITEAETQGTKVLVDGRNVCVPGKENGYYVGPTVIYQLRQDMAIAQEEVFGPVLAILRSNNLKDALEIEDANPYGNAAAEFTQNGRAARQVINKTSAGMIGDRGTIGIEGRGVAFCPCQTVFRTYRGITHEAFDGKEGQNGLLKNLFLMFGHGKLYE